MSAPHWSPGAFDATSALLSAEVSIAKPRPRPSTRKRSAVSHAFSRRRPLPISLLLLPFNSQKMDFSSQFLL